MTNLNWPLMVNNIPRSDLDELIEFLKQDDKHLTQGEQVRAFEKEWSDWLGVQHSVFVNSGASANLLTMTILKLLYGSGNVLVPPITWVSDIASVIQSGLEPRFVDVDVRTLGMDNELALDAINRHTNAVFITHVLGYDALTNQLCSLLNEYGIDLIEDVCESHGATHNDQKLGTFGLVSNFSFYYAHHMSTIEGGMICTNSAEVYEMAKMLRSHGMSRESSPSWHEFMKTNYPDLNPEFIFRYAGYNVRNTELGAVIGRAQLRRLDANIQIRNSNLKLFLDNLNPSKYFTEFKLAGCSNYALTLVSRTVSPKVIRFALQELGVEFRQGLSGGGNQLRQPYLEAYKLEPKSMPVADKLHSYGFYLGNYPDLDQNKIVELCSALNELPTESGERWI